MSTKICFRRGDTIDTTVTVVVDENDIPQSLSGATATWTIARCEGGEALIVKTTDDDVKATDAADVETARLRLAVRCIEVAINFSRSI